MKKLLVVPCLSLFLSLTLCLGLLQAEPPMAPPAADDAGTSAKASTAKKTKTKTKKDAKSSSGTTDSAKKSSSESKKSVAKEPKQPAAEADKPAAEDADKPAKEPKSPAEAKKAPAKETKQASDYEKFLEKYGAWDRLDKVYTNSDDPVVLLKRATMALQTGAPQQALELIESSAPFENKDMELQRLWLGGQAARAAGDPSKAVFWFSQAGQMLSAKERAAKFNSEPDLEILWTDVWRRYFWIYSANFGTMREGQEAVLKQTLDQARGVWKNNPFWEAAASALAGESTHSGKTPGDVLDIGDSDRNQIARTLAAACLEYPAEAKTLAANISTKEPREFWNAMAGFVAEGSDPSEAELHSSFPKASIFWGSNIMSRSAAGRTDWLLPEDQTQAWQDLRKKNRSLHDAAKRYLKRDADKDLEALPVFAQYRFALAVAQNDDAARDLWDALENKRNLPLSLKVCGLLLFEEPLDNLLPEDPNAAARQFVLLPALSSAGGRNIRPNQLAPFWLRLEGRQLDNAVRQLWPLDRLLLLADWSNRLQEKATPELAKRIAFLFPDTEAGVQATLQLADVALQAQQYQLAGFYLANIDGNRLPRKLKGRYLELKGDLAFALGGYEDAFNNYSELLKTGAEVSDSSRIKIAFILQQQGQLDVAQGQLEKLWERHKTMPTNMQAELLYYMAEGEHSMGNIDKALDYYLRLAWQYPQENIWALTAMFRAALIYDGMGQYDTAKNLLVTVIRNAETEQQREAAKNRLTEIEAKRGRAEERTKAGGGNMVYPF
jgi:hypothetical protein